MSDVAALVHIQVRIFQENGQHVGKSTFQVLAIDKSRMKLFKGKIVRAREEYSSSMQVCQIPIKPHTIVTLEGTDLFALI